jgi:hypothetical protein
MTEAETAFESGEMENVQHVSPLLQTFWLDLNKNVFVISPSLGHTLSSARRFWKSLSETMWSLRSQINVKLN